jgi:hypothetical protein
MESLPELQIFHLGYDEEINNEHEYTVYPGQPNEFNSSLWINHQWLFGVEIVVGKCIIYTIHP